MTDIPAPAGAASGETPATGAPPAASPAEVLYPTQSAEGEASVSPSEAEAEPLAASGEAAESEAAPSGEDTVGGDSGTDALMAAYELTLPEGFEADDTLMSSAKKTFAEAGVSAEKAQSLMDLYSSTLSAQRAKEEAAFNVTQNQWLAEINAQPDFQGPTREKSLQTMAAFLDEYGAEAKAGILADPRVGNNPALVKLILSAAKVLSEGAPSAPGRPAPNDANGRPTRGRTAAEVLYPNSQGT